MRRLDILALIIAIITFQHTKIFAEPQPQPQPYKFGFPFFSNPFQNYKRSTNDQMKSYSGYRASNDSLRMVYYHDLTIAIVELGEKKRLISCELIEIYEDAEGQQFLQTLNKRVNRPLQISFRDMLKLMKQCNQVEENKKNGNLVDARRSENLANEGEKASKQNMTQQINPFTLLNGVVPGTKWCGLGDLAKNFHDLGTEESMDRCCRSHDICPMKVRGYQTRYNITNDSVYTKSHCVCDDIFFGCLKRQTSVQAQVMGNIYFNLAQVPCIYEGKNGKIAYRKARSDF